MTKDEIIESLQDQAHDKDYQANGDPDSIFTGDAIALREAAKMLKTAPEWISVKEKLPEIGVKVLTLDKRGHVNDRSLYRFASGPLVFRPDGMIVGEHITHWMPMLEMPKGGSVG